MGHLGEGALRRLIDEPLAASQADRLHLEGCSTCRERSLSMAGEAEAAATLLAVPAIQPDTAAALARVRNLGATTAPAPRRAWANLSWSFPRVARPLALVAALAVIGALLVAAAPSLGFFSPNKGVVAVPVTASKPTNETIAGLPDLSKYGTSKVVTKGTTSTVLTAAEASSMSGLTVPAAPAAYASKTASYTVVSRSVVSFTFDEAMAKKAAADAGKPAPVFPKGIDKATLTVSAGPAVAIVYGTINRTDPFSSDILAEAITTPPVLTTTNGVKPAQLLDFLTKQPGIAENKDLVKQIRAIGDPLAAGNLVIPVPPDYADQSNVKLTDKAKTHAVVVAAKVGLVKAIVWESKSGGKTVVHAVGGHFDTEQLIAIASGIA